MADKISKAQRSAVMAKVKSQDTGAEYTVRRLLHRRGYRYRLSVRDLPGTPDIVLPRHKKVILVHGCFWHGHRGCLRSVRPTSNVQFWNTKLDNNIKRDRKVEKQLSALGWEILVIWECQLRNELGTEELLTNFLSCPNRTRSEHKRHGANP